MSASSTLKLLESHGDQAGTAKARWCEPGVSTSEPVQHCRIWEQPQSLVQLTGSLDASSDLRRALLP